MGHTTPPWLVDALDEALISAGATAGKEARACEISALLEAWNLEGRAQHNSRYLASLLERLAHVENAASEPALLCLAAAYRGATEEMGWEELGLAPVPSCVPAIVGSSTLSGLGVPEENVQRVGELVDALSAHSPDPSDLDAQLLVDADLAALAGSPQQCRTFQKGLREQMRHVTDEEFANARLQVVTALLSRPRIFHSPLAKTLEQRARKNLEGEQAILLSQLGPNYKPGSVSRPEAKKAARRVLLRTKPRNAGRKRLTSEAAATPVERSTTPTSAPPLPAPEPEDAPESEVTPTGPASEPIDDRDETSTLESVADRIEGARRRRI